MKARIQQKNLWLRKMMKFFHLSRRKSSLLWRGYPTSETHVSSILLLSAWLPAPSSINLWSKTLLMKQSIQSGQLLAKLSRPCCKIQNPLFTLLKKQLIATCPSLVATINTMLNNLWIFSWIKYPRSWLRNLQLLTMFLVVRQCPAWHVCLAKNKKIFLKKCIFSVYLFLSHNLTTSIS